MICTIHQIEHAAHLSLFNKFEKADIIVLGDTFQYKKNYFENRNKIKASNPEGWQWITIPVEKDNHKPINEVKIIYNQHWQDKYLKTLKQIYSVYPFFNDIYPEIEEIIITPYNSIGELNYDLLIKLMRFLNIKKQIILTADLHIDPKLKGTDLLVEICKKVAANTYLSGPSGKNYLELDKFGDIKVIFHELNPGLSVYDYLFTHGAKNG